MRIGGGNSPCGPRRLLESMTRSSHTQCCTARGFLSLAGVFLPELEKHGRMNDLLSRMEPGRPRGSFACSPGGEGHGPHLDSGARNPALAGTDRSLSAASGNLTSQTGENVDRQSWVREKVLFLLHPQRCLGTQADPACGGLVDSEDLPGSFGDHRYSEPNPKPSRRRIATAPGGQPRDPEATPRSVLVRVVDYQVTQEVLWTAWTKGSMTTRTEERSVTAVTFRTQRE